MAVLGDREVIALTELDQYILTKVNGVPEALLRQEVLNTLNDFCEWTQVWRLEVGPITIQADVQDYWIADLVPDYSMVDTIVDASKGTNKHKLIPGTDVTLVDRNTLRLESKPSARDVNGLNITVALRPTRNATEIDLEFFEDWYNEIADGVLSRLFSMDGRTWSNPGMFGLHESRYMLGKQKARHKVLRGGLNQVITATSRYQLVSRSQGFKRSVEWP